ncbi:uncharacterized protein LOC142986751 isoform X2 [Anticarsia gemmatalis]|uniref:uncharacterized protein LOC142986751 isoform X2 n=1 Tax=Anticarsia gemmatalis TaxID=129554 RepID=UPI003F75E543
MNSRSSVNESNLVNLSANLSTLDPLESKDTLALTFPFDHIYACHSEGSDRRQTLSLDKAVEISTHCVVTDQKDLVVSTNTEIARLSERLTAAENQNKKLKELLVYHLDLIQQQNDVISKKDKVYQALKQENDTLKTKVSRMDKRALTQHRQSHLTIPGSSVLHPLTGPAIAPLPIPIPLNIPIHPSASLSSLTALAAASASACTSTSTSASASTSVSPLPSTSTAVPTIKIEPGSSTPAMYNSYGEILLAENRNNKYPYKDPKDVKPYPPNHFDPSRTTETDAAYLSNLGVSSILDEKVKAEPKTMIDNKRSNLVKKDAKPETRPEPIYTVTTNSGNAIIHKIQRSRRKTTTSIGSLSRMPKTPAIKQEPPEPPPTSTSMYDDDSSFDRTFNVNKKKGMLNTYGKSKTSAFSKRPTHYTGSLSDRLQLIDTTPTGEDPYQLGEADMREQSPIPKLMLQKTNHGRLKVCTDLMGNSTTTSLRRIYDAPATETSTSVTTPINLGSRYNLSSTITHDSQENDELSSYLDTTPDTTMAGNAAQALETMDIKTIEICAQSSEQDFNEFESQGEVVGDSRARGLARPAPEPTRKRGGRTTSLMAPDFLMGEPSGNRGSESKRGRKRALSTTGLIKGAKQSAAKGSASKGRQSKGKAACRGKKSPVPGMVSHIPYHTAMGDSDISWYLGLSPSVTKDDIDQPSDKPSVEVPRWREKPYTSCYTLEGTENLDDKVFEKRHQKLEAEERRQLRWHMRRIREQRHVERLRQRQRDPWCSGFTSPAYQQPSVFTIWPQPQRDVRIIEITDTLPVMAFGEDLPELPPADFMLPWVRTSKALKRSKRSKTLH